MEEKVLSVLRRREALENGIESRVWDLTGAQWHLITPWFTCEGSHINSADNWFSSISKSKWIKYSSIFSVTHKTPNIILIYKVKVKSLSRVWLCDPMDCSLPGPSVHGILQAWILECVAISFSRGSSQSGIGPRSLHCRQILCPLSHQESPRIW